MGSKRLCTSMAISRSAAAAAAASSLCSASVFTGGFVMSTCMPRARHAFAIAKCVSSGVKMIATSPGSKAAAAFL